MSRTKPTGMEEVAVEWVSCGWCSRPAGTWCKAKSGRWAPRLHGARTWPIQRGWQLGYAAGRDLALDQMISAHDEPDRTYAQQWLDLMLARRREETHR